MRGMSHVGVLEVLCENKIPIDILVGCSSGAIIAAAYACGKLKELKEIATSFEGISKQKILDFTMTGEGLIKGGKIKSLFNFLTAEKKFEDLKDIDLSFVGTDALTGDEVVVDKGSIAEALEITTALPGFSPPKRYMGKMVIDGGAAMMVPTKIAYDRGADFVIGINVGVNRSFLTRTVGNIRKLLRSSGIAKLATPIFKVQKKVLSADEKKFLGRAKEIMKRIKLLDDYEKHHFNFLEVYLMGLRAISQDYTRGIFKDSDCDIPIRPKVLHIKRMDISKAPELIAEGRKATKEKIKEIKKFLAIRN